MKSHAKFAVFACLFLGSESSFAGSLDSPAPPADPASAMYTIEAIYNRLDTGAAGSRVVFSEPTAGPASSGRTLDEVMGKAPEVDGVTAGLGHVLSGKTFWAIGSGLWGRQTGTMSNRGAVVVTPTTSQQAIPQGYHDGTGYVAGDASLVTGNIRAGTSIFGVVGAVNVVDTTSGNAVAADIAAGKRAWVKGVEVTGLWMDFLPAVLAVHFQSPLFA